MSFGDAASPAETYTKASLHKPSHSFVGLSLQVIYTSTTSKITAPLTVYVESNR